jgi:hypothetical protein
MELLVNSGRRTTSVVVDHMVKTNEEQDPTLGTGLFPQMRRSSQMKRTKLEQSSEFLSESLILAQDERWRRA